MHVLIMPFLFALSITLFPQYLSTALPGKIQKPTTEKPYIWVYWENINRPNMPAHISLCRKTLLKHCAQSFNIIELNEKTIHDYLPELKQFDEDLNLSRLKIAQKVDFYRVLLLCKYGGIYLDSDMIVMRNLSDIADKLKLFDYVGFGEYYIGGRSYFSYGAPQNWVMASRKNGVLITAVLQNMLKILAETKDLSALELEEHIRVLLPNEEKNTTLPKGELPWHTLGKALLRSTLQPLIKEGYRYYHYTSEYDGTRDGFGKLVRTSRVFSSENIIYRDIDRLFFVFTSNAQVTEKMKDRAQMTEEQLLQENTNYAAFIKKSLGLLDTKKDHKK